MWAGPCPPVHPSPAWRRRAAIRASTSTPTTIGSGPGMSRGRPWTWRGRRESAARSLLKGGGGGQLSWFLYRLMGSARFREWVDREHAVTSGHRLAAARKLSWPRARNGQALLRPLPAGGDAATAGQGRRTTLPWLWPGYDQVGRHRQCLRNRSAGSIPRRSGTRWRHGRRADSSRNQLCRPEGRVGPWRLLDKRNVIMLRHQ